MVNLPDQNSVQLGESVTRARRRHPSHPHVNQTISRQSSSSARVSPGYSGFNHRVHTPGLGSSHRISEAVVKSRTRPRLPWLDGNTNSRSMPGAFDADHEPPAGSKQSAEIETQETEHTEVPGVTPLTAVYRSDLAYRAHGSTQSVAQVCPRPTLVKHISHPFIAPPSPRPSAQSLASMTRLISKNISQPSYSPSTYSLDVPSESGQSHLLPRKDPASYEKLVERPFSTISSAPNMEKVPPVLLQPDIPPRRSSLAFTATDTTTKPNGLTVESDDDNLPNCPPYSLGRHHDGTVSVQPPVRTASLQVRRSPSTQAAHYSKPLGLERANTNNSMQRAVTGLQSLMNEALQVANDAASQDRTEEVATVLNEATAALRKSSVVHERMVEPLVLSESEIGILSSEDSVEDSDLESEASSGPSSIVYSAGASHDTVPTVYTMSAQSVQLQTVMPPYTKDGKHPQSEEAESDNRKLDDSQLVSGSSEQSITTTPPRLYQPPSADSIVLDFAYVTPDPHTGKYSPSQSIELVDSSSSPVLSNPVLQPPAAALVGSPDDGSKAVASASSPEARPGDIALEPITVITTGPDSGGGARKRRQAGRHSDGRRVLESKYYYMPEKDGLVRVHRGDSKRHISFRGTESLRSHKYRRQPIARQWDKFRKRMTAVIACLNTALIGFIAGIYAGEVPKIQYQLGDIHHRVILGNVMLYIGLGITTIVAWPLPLLHGRKPYTLAALAIALPLQFPQAICVQTPRSPDASLYYVGLLLPRALSGMALGLANINFLATLFDLFGASLQAHRPHQEIVDVEDVRRQGGGMGLWLGAWAWCFVGSLAVGFLVGAAITASLDPDWGFYLVVILLAIFILINVVAPETRRAPHRRSVLHYFDEDERLKKKIARGEVKLHISQEGPVWWWEESWAGLKLMGRMMLQPGFFVLAWYLAWIYALVVLVTLLLGALLSRDYQWRPQYVGLAVFALAIGALLAIPLTKANLFSRARMQPARTDSMTFQSRVTWSSHFIRRCIFTFVLPVAGLAFLLSSPGRPLSAAVPIVMSVVVGFLSCLAVAECIGLVTEAFDTCDLQPGVNSKHRLQSMESSTRRRRTNYSSHPRVSAGLFTAQGLGFFLAAASTGVSGSLTRAIGAQAAVGVVAGILLGLTILLSLVLWRWKTVQVIPDHALGTMKGSKDWTADEDDAYWKPVVVGNPSGKLRRMNLLETGRWSRWTEIRKLNKLSKHASSLP